MKNDIAVKCPTNRCLKQNMESTEECVCDMFMSISNIVTANINPTLCDYNGPCDLRLPIQPAKYGLKLKFVLKYRDIYTENIQVVSLIFGLKMQGIVN